MQLLPLLQQACLGILRRILSADMWHGPSGRRLLIIGPLVWISVFFILPFTIVLKISFAKSIFDSPPYTPLMEWMNSTVLLIHLNFSNYLLMLQDNLYVAAYLQSLKLAAISTFFCLLLGYPMAYAIAQAPKRWQANLLVLVILPFWTSFLIRVYAWIGLLSSHGVINKLLQALGLIDQPLSLLNNNFAVCLGLVYSYLPFMILPIYTTLEKIDPVLIEAAADLGARPFHIFRKVILPLSRPGIVGGAMLVFIPAMGEFVIPELLGGPETLMIGKILWGEFFNNQDWPMASAMAVALLILLIFPLILFQRFQMKSR